LVRGQASPASLNICAADAISYNSMQVNFQGIYDTVKRVARAAFPQGQQGNADLIDTIAQQNWEACAGCDWVAERRICFHADEPVDGLHKNKFIFLASERSRKR